MSVENDKLPDTRFSLKRWSNRKLAAARASAAESMTPPPAVSTPAAAGASPAVEDTTAPAPVAAQEPALAMVEALTFESDFRAFLQPKVAETVKRAALKKLFQDPHFNVMDGLDVYIDDYSIPSPLEPGLIEQMAHARYTLNPPRTRITAEGHVEDVPPEETVSESQDAPRRDEASGKQDTLAAAIPTRLALHEDAAASSANDPGADEMPAPPDAIR
ncbi:MAG: DUF3306 domain-containing protein [Betaproteobacteria bacterium]